MTYQQFINAISYPVGQLFNLLKQVYNFLIGNYIFRTLLFIILFALLVDFFFLRIRLILDIILSNRKATNREEFEEYKREVREYRKNKVKH